MSVYEPLYFWLQPNPSVPDWVIILFLGLFCAASIACAVVDARSMIIPNLIVYPMILISLIAAPFLWENWVTHLIAGAVCAVFFTAAAFIKIRGQYAMGMGDAKLYTASGLALGVGALPCVIIATLSGTIIQLLQKLLAKPVDTAKIKEHRKQWPGNEKVANGKLKKQAGSDRTRLHRAAKAIEEEGFNVYLEEDEDFTAKSAQVKLWAYFDRAGNIDSLTIGLNGETDSPAGKRLIQEAMESQGLGVIVTMKGRLFYMPPGSHNQQTITYFECDPYFPHGPHIALGIIALSALGVWGWLG